jgi:hypothetical protein
MKRRHADANAVQTRIAPPSNARIVQPKIPDRITSGLDDGNDA